MFISFHTWLTYVVIQYLNCVDFNSNTTAGELLVAAVSHP